MDARNLSRRRLLRGGGALAGMVALGLGERDAGAQAAGKTPPLTGEEREAIERALGKKGTYVEAQDVYTVPLPRNDLKVKVQGEPVPIPFGFGGWVSLKKTRDGKSAVLMSDTVLLPDEVNPLIDAIHANGLEISALHNHFFYEEPRIVYLHLHGVGAVADLAARYAAALRSNKSLPANQPPAGPAPARTGKDLFDLPALDKIVGSAAVVNGPTCKYTLGRSDLSVLAMGAEITAAIGLNSWASFAGTAEAAHIAGDVAMVESEVNPVIQTLRSGGIDVVALHHHMLGEEPRMVFLHYYGRGRSLALAGTFRAALDVLGKAGPGTGRHSGAA